MKRCPVDATPMTPIHRHPGDPALDVFQCDGDDSRAEGDRVHRFKRYDCRDDYKAKGE